MISDVISWSNKCNENSLNSSKSPISHTTSPSHKNRPFTPSLCLVPKKIINNVRVSTSDMVLEEAHLWVSCSYNHCWPREMWFCGKFEEWVWAANCNNTQLTILTKFRLSFWRASKCFYCTTNIRIAHSLVIPLAHICCYSLASSFLPWRKDISSECFYFHQ